MHDNEFEPVGEALPMEPAPGKGGIRLKVGIAHADALALMAVAEERGLTLTETAKQLLAEALAPYREAGAAMRERARQARKQRAGNGVVGDASHPETS